MALFFFNALILNIKFATYPIKVNFEKGTNH
jgi:hypothetical protein